MKSIILGTGRLFPLSFTNDPPGKGRCPLNPQKRLGPWQTHVACVKPRVRSQLTLPLLASSYHTYICTRFMYIHINHADKTFLLCPCLSPLLPSLCRHLLNALVVLACKHLPTAALKMIFSIRSIYTHLASCPYTRTRSYGFAHSPTYLLV